MENDMTDDNTAPDPTGFLRDYEEKDRTLKALSTSLHTANKKALFDTLEAAGITSVHVTFDGSGDSGQIEEIGAVSGDQPRDFPAGMVILGRAYWGRSEADLVECSVYQAVETLAYDFLEETHSGWENNAGAYGEFAFDVAGRSITLDYNERFEDSEYTQHIY
jgi:hypothetical protein